MALLAMLAAQDRLDKLIINNLDLKEDLILNTVVALDVEMGEMANEKRWFKHWSLNKEAKEGLLLEIADVMHFYFSLAIQKNFISSLPVACTKKELKADDATKIYLQMKTMLFQSFKELNGRKDNSDYFSNSWELFLDFALNYCGFTFEELENAYFTKNEINFNRQKEGY